MRLVVETFKIIVNRDQRRSQSESTTTTENKDNKMLTSCSCPQLSIKTNTEETPPNKLLTSSSVDRLHCDDNIDVIEDEYVFLPPLTKSQDALEFRNSSSDSCSIESSVKSVDSLLSSPSSYGSSENQPSASDPGYKSCIDCGVNHQSSVKSYDKLLSSSLPCDKSNENKSYGSNSEYQSCLEREVNSRRPICQRQTSNASSGSDPIEVDYEPVALPYSKIPGRALSIKTRTQMSLHMNIPLTLGNDWKMLASEFGFCYEETENFALQSNPSGSMINQWCTREDSTLERLMDALTFIERFDVINSIKKFIERDAETWRKNVEREANPYEPTPILELSERTYPNLPETPENRGITLHDHPDGPIEVFDAFVCFTIDDRAFVKELISNLENAPYNMKLCVGFRDLVPGAAWMTSAAELIGKRCKRMIVVLSPRFTKSAECDFHSKFALSLTPGNRSKRIVPIMYEMCSVPEILRFICVCDYTIEDLRPFFWERLVAALALN